MINTILYFLVIINLVNISTQNVLKDDDILYDNLKLYDNIFSTPDLSIDYTLNRETIHLDAYKTTNNDIIISSGNPALFGGLKWVSIGRPKLIQIKNESQNKFFQFENEKFSIYFTLLTDKDKQVLQKEVRRVKGIELDINSFVNLKANSIDCSVRFFDDKSEKVIILYGKVEDMISSPFEVEFNYEKNYPDRIAFQKRILSNSSLDFKCTITAGSTIKKTNTFTITLQQSNDIRLSEKIFGSSNESCVTRDQLSELANEVNSYFNVVEDYQMPEEQFNAAFVESLITLAGDSSFNPVSFQDGLQMLSKYTLNFDEDLKPDIITKELSNVFKVEQTNNKSHVVFDEKYYNELSKQSSSSGGGKISAGIFGIGGGKASANFAKSQSEHWLDKGSSLNDQLNELNSYSENQIQYEFQGNKIVPKSIKISKMQSSLFKKTLTFSRIKNVYFEADFLKKFTLSTKRSALVSEQIANLQELLTYRFPENTILMIGSDVINKYFDSTGKGISRMVDWYVCNGKNGAPDLRGRFIVGKDETKHDYSSTGKTGGLEEIVLKASQMPSHTHIDNGHSHSINLITSLAGEHNHEYKDLYKGIYYSGSIPPGYVDSIPGYISVNNPTSGSGIQWSRATSIVGHHQHSVNGNSKDSHANLQKIGNDLPHENRPPYYVVQYIIYKPK